MDGKYFVFTGPSGAGKTTVVEALLASVPNSARLVTTTTRGPRPNEVDGKDYHFTTREDFLARKAQGEFFEFDEHYGTFYGSSQKDLDALLAKHRVVFGVIDPSGSAKLKQLVSCTVVFLDVANIQVLEERLRDREGMEPAQVAVRLAQYQKERNLANAFDHIVINRNGEIEKTLAVCRDIIDTVTNSRPESAAKRQRIQQAEEGSVKGRACVVTSAGGDFQLVEKEYPLPPSGHVRVRVKACGVCHSDSFTKLGFLGNQFPRAPGHEVAGVVDAVGADVHLKKGQRVGLGWHGGHCNVCVPCQQGDFVLCESGQVPGGSYDGGYADYVIAPANALALIPDDLKDVEAAPLLCAGITTFNSLRNSGARPGDIVAIVGIGGLGHLAVQYAAKSGYRTVAIARGQDKAPLAKQLGAHTYIDSTTCDVAAELLRMGGAKVILSTVTNADAVEAVFGGLAANGKLMINGALDRPLSVSSMTMIGKRQSIQGWPSGCAKDSEDTLKFSALCGVRPMVETVPLEKAAEGYERMMSGKARFRVVLTME